MLSLQESLNRYFRAFLVKHGQARVKTSSIHSKLTPLAGTPKIYFLALCRLKPRTQASLKLYTMCLGPLKRVQARLTHKAIALKR